MAAGDGNAAKWSGIVAVVGLLVFGLVSYSLFSNGIICSARHGETIEWAACPDQQDIDDRIDDISDNDEAELRKLATAIASNEAKARAVAKEVYEERPDLLLQIANIRRENRDSTLFSLNDRSLIEHLDEEFDKLTGHEGPDRFKNMRRAIEKVALWDGLREDARRRSTIFRPLAEKFEATLPLNPPSACIVRTKVSGPFVDGDMIYIESEDGTARIVREASSDPLAGATYQFQVGPSDAEKLRLTKSSQTRGIVYARLAERQEREDLYPSCRAGEGPG